MEQLFKLLKELLNLTDEENQYFYSNLQKRQFKSRSILINEGSIAKCIYFIDTGVLRTYYLKEGKEISTYFACDKQFISTFSSFITQTSSFEYLSAIEDSIVYELSFSNLNKLYEESSKFEKLGRILAEKNYLCILDRTLAMQTKSAKDKYLDFVENYDAKILQRVPQHQIASFLGIAPESLSRIRKELSIS